MVNYRGKLKLGTEPVETPQHLRHLTTAVLVGAVELNQRVKADYFRFSIPYNRAQHIEAIHAIKLEVAVATVDMDVITNEVLSRRIEPLEILLKSVLEILFAYLHLDIEHPVRTINREFCDAFPIPYRIGGIK
jgi:hypothetical protein